MSDFARPGGAALDPGGPGPWVPLPPAARRVAGRVAAAGAPLKEWGINIYRGVLTGCNEAFIIDSGKRDEILGNCQSDEERERTADLMRPILRGRDIKRYGYVDNGLYLINTHNGIRGKLSRVDIDAYPSVKAHLDKYWDKISTRSDQGDTPYNLRHCIYMDDFFKPKIIYPNMTKFMPFVLDNKSFITNQKCFIITGEHLAYLTAFFNSSLFKFCFRDFFPELQGGTRELSKIFFDKIPVLKVSDDQNKVFQAAVEDIQHEYTSQKAQRVESMLFDLYNLTPEEREIIGSAKVD